MRLTDTIDELRANGTDLEWWRRRLDHRVGAPLSQVRYGTGGVDVMGAEWDTLLVLDACRADLFEAVADLGTFDAYRRVTSRASMTAEWVEKNFLDRRFGDTVYVNANPLVARIAPDRFHRLENVWETGFDETVGTVRPETVVDAARMAHERYPDKRLVVHFVQPHHPFYAGDLDIDTRSWTDLTEIDGNGGDERDERGGIGGGGRASREGFHSPWEALRAGVVSKEAVRDAYAATLRDGLEYALALAADLPGRVVLTSDHGNAFGERRLLYPRRVYGHPREFRYPSLVRVPWAVRESTGPRPRIRDGGTNAAEPVASAVVDDRLAALGYR